MTRFLLRRLAALPFALVLANFLSFAYAHLVRPAHFQTSPLFAVTVKAEPLLPVYAAYVRDLSSLNFGELPNQAQVGNAVFSGLGASLVLLGFALVISTALGLGLGYRGVRSTPPAVAAWLTSLTTLGLAMPSFYIGSMLVMGLVAYLIRGPLDKPLLPLQGYGLDSHLILPVLVLAVRPTAQVAQMTASLLAAELDKQYVIAARSFGHPWQRVRWRHVLRNILAPVIVTIAGSFRLLIGELIVVEWLFSWPGLGRLLASTLIPSTVSNSPQRLLFLNPPLIAAVVTVLAALFLLSEGIASVLSMAADPRLRAAAAETGDV